jgi:hypothetical protein
MRGRRRPPRVSLSGHDARRSQLHQLRTSVRLEVDLLRLDEGPLRTKLRPAELNAGFQSAEVDE